MILKPRRYLIDYELKSPT